MRERLAQLWEELGRRPELPTYLGGWMASLAWISVVGGTIGDSSFTGLMVGLTSFGYGVSFWLRGFRGTPEWPVLERDVVHRSHLLRFLFYILVVFPGLLSWHPFAALIPGEATGAAEWMMGVAFMWGMALYSFGLVTDGLVAFGAVVGVAMFGLTASGNVNPEVGVGFLIFLLGTVLMLSNMTLAHHAGRRRGAPAAAEAGRWLGDQVIVAGLIVSVTAALSIVGAVALQRMSPSGLVAGLALSSRLGGVPSVSGYAGFADRMVLGTGEAGGMMPVFQAQVTDSYGVLYRRRVYDRYTGHSWEGMLHGEPVVVVSPGQTDVPVRWNQRWAADNEGGKRVYQQIHFIAPGDLAAAPMVTRLRLPSSATTWPLYLDRYGDALLSFQAGATVDVESWVPRPDKAAVRQAQPVDPRQWTALLHVPVTSRASVEPVAAALSAGKTNLYDVALAIENYLETQFTYDQAAKVPRRSADAMEYYFEHKRGACDLIATAMVLLARSSGIPARVAVGYNKGTRQDDGSWLVTRADAHAWAELYFDGFGWLDFNPAVPSATAGAGLGVGQTLYERALQLDRQSLEILLFLAALAWLTVYAVRELRRSRPWFEPTPAGRVAAAYHRAQRLLGTRGLARLRSETPQEHLGRVQGVAAGAAWLSALTMLARAYELVRYDLAQPTEELAGGAETAGRALRRGLRRYRRR
ncbi:MAG: transglutaminase domain-containing protein [Armatimonadetes bacterium]|nr:transglutaminase domain-containing protein [Armatimonadota bacterium]